MILPTATAALKPAALSEQSMDLGDYSWDES